MKRQDKWKRFEQTGRVTDYLDYCRASAAGDRCVSAGDTACQVVNGTGEQYGNRAGRSDRDGADGITGERVR